jgi:hypothetical protein
MTAGATILPTHRRRCACVDKRIEKTLDRHRLLFRAAGIAALNLLAACSQMPGARNVPPGASFTADILADDTKLFTFSVRLPKPSLDRERGFRGEEDPQADGRRRAPIDYAEGSKRALQAMIEENRYCREGYVLHELYEDRLDYVIRGECRDAATEADRARFSHR